ncbi:sodium/hydrogen exchanger family protein [Hypericibacter terrae]|uniref:Sodium/hydrogen exchanger family protein n=1 Tax=Hypericibacter terrae TaxID=2602015 RepID=A0A5J6MQ43_9PROT|nr:cation:proton antiporter [Hypericibacter terrae]QEX19638.1 sodium/hydrogen exchanger family protein [Hypericibacter terrae]
MQGVVSTVFGLAGLFVLVSLLPSLARRLLLPETVLLAMLGVGLGVVIELGQANQGDMANDFLTALSNLEIPGDAFLYIFLPPLLFEMALKLDVRRLMDEIVPILLMAIVAVIVTALVVGAALWQFTGAGLLAALLLGAVIATTDPAAVVGIFRDIGAPRRLTLLVQGESLFNDAAAIALASLIAGLITGHGEGSMVHTVVDFLLEFLGGALFGYLVSRGAALMLPALRGFKYAEMTFTVALAYLSFIVGTQYLHVSGVVACVVAGLTLGTNGRTRVTPTSWESLVETWEQLGFWSNSLIFVLAAMLVPQLLAGLAPVDFLRLGVLVAAALVARAVVVYGLLPPLAAMRLTGKVSAAYRAVIVWGGLRGAVSLALALGVAADPELPAETRHLVGVLTTGFVLFTLFVNAPTLRPLLRLLGLDKLGATERALRAGALDLAHAEAKTKVETAVAAEGLDPALTKRVFDQIEAPLGTAPPAAAAEAEIAKSASAASGERELDMAAVALSIITQYEVELVHQRLREGTVSRKTTESKLADASRLMDGIKQGGAEGYVKAVDEILKFPRRIRWGMHLQQWFAIERPLAEMLGDRFNKLFVSSLLLMDLGEFLRRRVRPVVGEGAAAAAGAVLQRRREGVAKALGALRLQYPDYAHQLEELYVSRLALRSIEDGYIAMQKESVLSEEVYDNLIRGLNQRRRRAFRQLRLDIAMAPETLLQRVRLFQGLSNDGRRRVAKLMRPRLALPGEEIVKAGEHGDTMFFITTGAVEVVLPHTPVRLGTGEFFGEVALVTNRPRTADVVALSYSNLLVLSARDLARLSEADPEIGREIAAVAQARIAAFDSAVG